MWAEKRIAKQHLAKLPIPTSEQLAPGHKSEWKLWKSLNRLRTGRPMSRRKTNLSKWDYADTADTACANAGPQSRPCNTCWDAHFLKMKAAWKIWRLLMRRLSTVQEPGQTYDSVQGWRTRKKKTITQGEGFQSLDVADPALGAIGTPSPPHLMFDPVLYQNTEK